MRKVFGPITVLVNNAAHDERHTLEEVTPEYFDERIAVNLKHQFFAIQAVVGDMKKARNGSIVNIGSNSWMVAHGGLPVYATAKSGVLGLTRGLARELGKYNVRINHIAPGWILTPRQLELWATPESLAQLMQRPVPAAPVEGRRHRPRRAVLRLRRGLRGDQPDLRLRRRLAVGRASS